MATLRQYFDTDFPNYMNSMMTWPGRVGSEPHEIIARLHLDFNAGATFASFYVPRNSHPLAVCIFLIERVSDLINNVNRTVEVRLGFPGEMQRMADLKFCGRIFVYSETELSEVETAKLKVAAATANVIIMVRSSAMVDLRSASEKPLAFISHDSRDKDAVARPLAVALSKLNCPVWYDEFSLRVGDSLRESIESGLKNCPKCIVILSPNFIENSGWSRTEFTSIFTREHVEKEKVILPIWHGVSSSQVYEYCPMLADRFALTWNSNADVVANQLFAAINDRRGGRWTTKPVSSP